MSLRIKNCRATITRQLADHSTITVMPTPPKTGSVIAMVQPAKDGAILSDPQWADTSPMQNDTLMYATHKIFIGGADENGDTYEPRPGDQIVITGGSRLINSTYRQVAYVGHHEGQGLDHWVLPCVKVKQALV